MDMFRNAMALRLQSHYGKFLTADKDEVSVYQDSNGSSNSARWTVEFVEGTDNVIRLKSCYKKYLTASNLPFLLKMTGLKVLQTLPTGRLDSSVKWEPIREGNRVKLRTQHGNLLRADGGVPPWRKSVTHHAHDDKTSTKDHLLWYVDVVATHPPCLELPTRTDPFGDSVALTESNSPPIIQWSILRRRESSDSLDDLPAAAKVSEGRKIYYQVADEYGNVEEGCEVPFISFKGNEVTELTRVLEDETGLESIVLCTISALNDKLYPLRLHLPPNNVLESSSDGQISSPLYSNHHRMVRFLVPFSGNNVLESSSDGQISSPL